MDYRELLLKYMNFVAECEGIDYTRRISRDAVEFDDEEVKELRCIAEESQHRSLLQYSLRKRDT